MKQPASTPHYEAVHTTIVWYLCRYTLSTTIISKAYGNIRMDTKLV